VQKEIPIRGEKFSLFVYGTLMRGGSRHRVLAAKRFLGPVRTQVRYALFDLGAYPGLVHRDQGGQAIEGELYEVETSLIPRLDRIEGAPELYRLEPIDLEDAGPAYAYFYQSPIQGREECAGGRWEKRR
jgi:gamma-glutamylcyclotransferase (GGCT)/AIG2-like uncharacterized protein YtfP